MKCLIVYNPFSGKQKFIKHKEYVKKRLLEKYEEVNIFRSIAQKSITQYIASFGMFFDTLVACGGDGTLNEAINGLMQIPEDKRPTLAYIPSGTVNDVGHMLKLNRNITKIVDLILYGEPTKMDVCKIANHHFIYAAGVGKFTDVSYKASKKMKRRFGRMAYFLEGLRSITAEETIEMELTFNDVEERVGGKYYVVLALNSRHIAGFKLHRKKPTKLNDGLIDITMLDSSRFHFSIINLAAFFMLGDFWTSGVTTYQCSKVKLKSKQELSYNVDGEYACKSDDVEIEVVPQAINIIVHPKAKKRYF